MQMLVTRYLEQSMQSLTSQQDKFRAQMAQAINNTSFGPLEEQVRRNLEMFEKIFAMFSPFARPQQGKPASATPGKPASSGGGSDMDDLKRQLDEMQTRIDRMSGGGKD